MTDKEKAEDWIYNNSCLVDIFPEDFIEERVDWDKVKEMYLEAYSFIKEIADGHN